MSLLQASSIVSDAMAVRREIEARDNLITALRAELADLEVSLAAREATIVSLQLKLDAAKCLASEYEARLDYQFTAMLCV